MNHSQPESLPAHEPATTPITRRRAIAGVGAAVGAAALSPLAFAQQAQALGGSKIDFSSLGYDSGKGEYVLPPLPYGYDALEPHLDAQTMEIHHTKHHAGYVAGLNKAVAELKKIREGAPGSDPGLIKHWSRELAFHGGGHVNHTLFWVTLTPPDSPGAKAGPIGPLATALRESFGSVDAFKAHFTAAANAVEGGGWAWLMYEPVSRRLIVTQMEKQQEIYMTGSVPLLGVDVWEHAYYLRYQNRRADYVKAFWNVVNWPMVGAMLIAARGS